jgi:periplasmic protein CpxP/Spy
MMKHRLARLAAVGTALTIGLFATAAEAQDRPQDDDRRGGRAERFDPAQRVARRVALLTERLQLNASQQTQVRSILTQELNAMQAFRPKNGDDARRQDSAQRDSIRTQMRALRERTEQRIEGVLTEQQRTKYRELQQSLQQRRGPGIR